MPAGGPPASPWPLLAASGHAWPRLATPGIFGILATLWATSWPPLFFAILAGLVSFWSTVAALQISGRLMKISLWLQRPRQEGDCELKSVAGKLGLTGQKAVAETKKKCVVLGTPVFFKGHFSGLLSHFISTTPLFLIHIFLNHYVNIVCQSISHTFKPQPTKISPVELLSVLPSKNLE